MGRPPIGKRAMSSAERQRRYWERVLQGKAAQPDDGATDEIAALKAEIAALRAKTSARATKPARTTSRPEFSEAGRVPAEIGKLKSDIIKLKAMLAEAPDVAKLRKKVIDLQVEMASMRKTMKAIAKERDKLQHYARPNYRAAGKLLTPKNHNVLINALHPDRRKHVSPAELAEAERVCVSLRPLFIEKD
jgi:chromosome segregation ATPase